MKRLMIFICAFIPAVMGAQSFNVLDIRPAHDSGKQITQEGANSYGIRLYPVAFIN